ncbi:hypothetical protein GCM10010116_11650 [Microbispora rosea subsp. aerata]|nr:glycosyltransferase family A protein [Microbispora rosea]GGO05934.1 hypothetical protein GCM10010116_11650 [Microbispora rosea subsp. aerata]GIH55226.1 hypothetical protein Mro02_21400 [Microbispora rosea subsp. aerata]GLJ82676.1 hypothetical protein GCM10017588_14010 [Microbispora rosea subsp. aerata]
MKTGNGQRVDRGIDVSVVVPAYNRRASLDRCLTSLLVQRVAKEIIVVDGGSRDGTRALLDLYAAHHPRLITVIEDAQPGTPGGARNRGLDRAAGRYVFFCDAGDHLAPDALARLVATADRTGADVVVGKVAGTRHGVRESADRASLTAVYDDLTCFKLFRRDFLARHGIRFDETQRRGEDMTFTVHAYCHARVISVVADHDCYHAEGGGEASARDPLGWLRVVRTPIEVMARHVPPGPLRDRLLLRHLRRDVLAQLGAPFLAACEAEREKIAVEVADICGQWLTPGVRAALDGVDAARITALDDPDRLVRLARVEAAPLRHRLTGVAWQGDHLVIDGWAVLAGMEGPTPGDTTASGIAVGGIAPGGAGLRGGRLKSTQPDRARLDSAEPKGAEPDNADQDSLGPDSAQLEGARLGNPELDSAGPEARTGADGIGGASALARVRLGSAELKSAQPDRSAEPDSEGPASARLDGVGPEARTGADGIGGASALARMRLGDAGGKGAEPGSARLCSAGLDCAELDGGVSVVLRERQSRKEFTPAVTRGAAGFFTAVVDAAELPPGVWDVHVAVECEGARRLARLGSRRDPSLRAPDAHMVGGVVAVPFFSRSQGHLGVDAGGHVVRVPAAVRLTRAWWRGRRLRVEGRVLVGDEPAAAGVRHLIWRERTSGREHRERAVAIGPREFAAETVGLRPGTWDAYLELDLGGPPVRFPVKVADADTLDRPLRWWSGLLPWGALQRTPSRRTRSGRAPLRRTPAKGSPSPGGPLRRGPSQGGASQGSSSRGGPSWAGTLRRGLSHVNGFREGTSKGSAAWWEPLYWGPAQWTVRPYATAVNRRLSVSVRAATPLSMVKRVIRALHSAPYCK